MSWSQQAALDRANYYSDSRVIAAMATPAYKVVEAGPDVSVIELTETLVESLIEDGLLPEGHDGRMEVGSKFEVCTMCNGSGKVVNPSIDAGGITRDEFDDDPGFRESYFAGHYDITCPECNGARVVPQLVFKDDDPIVAAIYKWEDDEYAYARSCAAERAFGC